MKAPKGLKRRDFVRTTLAGGIAGLFPFKMISGQNEAPDEVKVQYRMLGKTGLKVSAVSFGAMTTSDAGVIHHALDYGVNYIDTAACYMDGNNEIIVGSVLKSRRKEAFIATKVHIGPEERMMKSVEKSLKKLNTDVIDVIQLHGLDEREQILHEGAMNALDKMRKKGMVRFLGFTTHENQAECLKTAIESKFYDTVLVAYNFKSDAEVGNAIEAAGKAGIGIIAMKTQAGGYQSKERGGWSPHQAALRGVLKNPYVSNAIPGMVSFAQVDENIGAMKEAFGWHDQEILNRYGQKFDHEICRMCGGCRKQCPRNIPIQDVNRSLMYAEGYRNYGLAIKTYAGLALSACEDCASCVVKCKNNLDIPSRLRRAKELFGNVRA